MCVIVLYDEKFLSGEQQKIEDCYTEIGRQYYAAHKNDAQPEFAGLFEAVKKSEKAMADHRAEVLRANGLMLCPRCGEQIFLNSIFCNFCGVRVVEEKPAAEPVPEEAAAEEPAKEEITAEENDAVEAGADDINSAEAPDSDPVQEDIVSNPDAELPGDEADFVPVFAESPTKTFEPKDPEEPVTEEINTPPARGKIICRNCGAEIDDDCFFCVECGSRIEKREKKAEKTPEEAKQGGVRFCVECGFRVTDPEAVFCNSCGSRLEASPHGEAPRKAPKRVIKRCARCGFTTDDPEVLFCIECGKKL